MAQISEHLTTSEMACRDNCGRGTQPEDTAAAFADLFESARFILGRPIHFKSGCRCFARNVAVGGVTDSAHTELPCTAGDMKAASGLERWELIVAFVLGALRLIYNLPGFDWHEAFVNIRQVLRGIGIAKSFVHIDVSFTKPRPSAWGYGPDGGGA